MLDGNEKDIKKSEVCACSQKSAKLSPEFSVVFVFIEEIRPPVACSFEWFLEWRAKIKQRTFWLQR